MTAVELGVPYMRDVRLAMNVAEADERRLAVVFAASEKERKAVEGRLSRLAWAGNVIGTLVTAFSKSAPRAASASRFGVIALGYP